jgi:catechol 2,3-dioxygenase-like lactoylglutathione lyase family enzyme|uniref:VOC domain-containing protein n=1 Tax=Leptospirillum ferriphilum TaxID=178606 RepID=A0A7C3QTD8_9BACT
MAAEKPAEPIGQFRVPGMDGIHTAQEATRNLGPSPSTEIRSRHDSLHDLDEACRFYCDILGATYFMKVDDETFRRFGRPPAPRNGEGAHRISLYLGGPTRLDLFFQTKGQPSSEIGHPHIAFEARPSDLLYWKERLQSSGIPVEGPLQLGPPGQASLYFNDPFGNHLEITCMGFWKDFQIRPPSMPDLIWHPGRVQ